MAKDRRETTYVKLSFKPSSSQNELIYQGLLYSEPEYTGLEITLIKKRCKMNKVLIDRFNQCNLMPDDVLSKIVIRDNKQAVFIYTSQLENLGTKDSDFDIYVLTETMPSDESMRDEPNKKVQIAIVNGNMLDIEYWDIKFVYTLIDKISSQSYNKVSSDELKLIHRLKIAEVISGYETGSSVKALIQNSSLKELVVKSYLLSANSELQDAITLYESQEYICALHCGRIALENAIGALNAKNGFTNLKNKWISKIFINNKGYNEELLKKYLQYQVYCNINSSNVEDFVENMLEFTQNIISLVAI